MPSTSLSPAAQSAGDSLYLGVNMLTANPDAGLPRALAARAVSVTPGMVSMWAQRGWYDQDGAHHTLTVVGHHRTLGRLYRYGDLLAAEKATRHSEQSFRGVPRKRKAKPEPVAA